MTSPVLALRKAIIARCIGDQELASLMGGAVRLTDEPARGSEPVYAAFGEVSARDWSTDLDRGHEQAAAVVVWAEPGSVATALAAAERIAMLIDDADLALDGHHLVQIRVTAVETARDDRTNQASVLVRLRAVTEVA